MRESRALRGARVKGTHAGARNARDFLFADLGTRRAILLCMNENTGEIVLSIERTSPMAAQYEANERWQHARGQVVREARRLCDAYPADVRLQTLYALLVCEQKQRDGLATLLTVP